MTSPSSPLENALVLCLEAIERTLRVDAPTLAFTAADVVPPEGAAHLFALTGAGDGHLAVGVADVSALTTLVGTKLDELAAALSEDLSAALDRPVSVSPPAGEAAPIADATMSVRATLEGLDEPASMWVAVSADLETTIGDLVRDRLDNLDPAPAGGPSEPVEVLNAEFPQMAPTQGAGGHHDMSLLSDVELDITVELGRTTMRVRDLLELGSGSVVELDRSAGTPVDVLVNGTIVARGEVVVVDDELGVRVTEVVHHDEVPS